MGTEYSRKGSHDQVLSKTFEKFRYLKYSENYDYPLYMPRIPSSRQIEATIVSNEVGLSETCFLCLTISIGTRNEAATNSAQLAANTWLTGLQNPVIGAIVFRRELYVTKNKAAGN